MFTSAPALTKSSVHSVVLQSAALNKAVKALLWSVAFTSAPDCSNNRTHGTLLEFVAAISAV